MNRDVQPMKIPACFVGLFLLAGLGTSNSLLAANISGIDLQLIGDSNPAKAEFDRDIEATTSLKGRVTGNLFANSLADDNLLSSGFSMNAAASYSHNVTINELGESLYRISLDYFREDKRRGMTPFYRLSIGANYLDSETNIRDGAIIDALASLNLQPTNFFDATVGLRLESRQAETAVFDSTKNQLFVTANFSPFNRLVVRTGLRYVFGDEISSATPTLDIVSNAKAIEPDAAFGGTDANRFAYLINANSAIAEVRIRLRINGGHPGQSAVSLR